MIRARRGGSIPSVHVALAVARRACAPLPRKVCGWCQKVLREGPEPASHGICEACLQANFPKKPKAKP
jgi:hypothetical protein